MLAALCLYALGIIAGTILLGWLLGLLFKKDPR